MYRLEIERAARRALAQLPQRAYDRVAAAIDALSHTPRPSGCVKLTGTDLWRIRCGDYWVMYAIDDGVRIVTVVDVGHRRDVYR